ncbi:MAG: hypothetical protein AAFO94_12165 [Bacteroidota bacterium]
MKSLLPDTAGRSFLWPSSYFNISNAPFADISHRNCCNMFEFVCFRENKQIRPDPIQLFNMRRSIFQWLGTVLFLLLFGAFVFINQSFVMVSKAGNSSQEVARPGLNQRINDLILLPRRMLVLRSKDPFEKEICEKQV